VDKSEFQKHISSIYKFINAGDKGMALKMLSILFRAYPEEKETLVKVKAEILLSDLDKKRYRDKYFSNKATLEQYKFFFGELSSELQWYVVEYSDEGITAVNALTLEIKEYHHVVDSLESDNLKDKVVYAEHTIFNSDILTLKKDEGINGFKVPAYLFYKSFEAEVLLQVIDINEIINLNCFFILVGEKGIDDCFSDLCVQIPDLIFSFGTDELSCVDKLRTLVYERRKRVEYGIKKICEYYSGKDSGLDYRLKIKKPRILFWTSRYTTTIQYHTRDAMESAIKAGCECRYLIEPDMLRRVTKEKQVEVFLDFKPDVVFDIDHFRFENSFYIPKEIVYVTWIQDPLKVILDPDSAKKLTSRDCLLNHLINDSQIKNIYGNLLIDAPIPASSSVYKTYNLTDEEKKNYSADICFVCHASDAEVYIKKMISAYEESFGDSGVTDIIRLILYEYRQMAYAGDFFYSKEEFAEYIRKVSVHNGYELDNGFRDALADELEKWYNQRLFRQVLVDWILEAGFTNVKLWGNGWMTNPKYSKYAMGPAQNGEILSKIYQSSKIVVGNNIRTTGAARVWECMLSGGFYLSNYIPADNDICDIRKLIPEGSYEMFKTKEELIEKLKRYIEDDAMRNEMAQKGRNAAIRSMTFDALIENLLNVLPNYVR